MCAPALTYSISRLEATDMPHSAFKVFEIQLQPHLHPGQARSWLLESFDSIQSLWIESAQTKSREGGRRAKMGTEGEQHRL